MAWEEMLLALEGEAAARYERIRRRAEEEAQGLRTAAEERCRPLQAEALARTQPALVAERARRLMRARFTVRKGAILAKEALIDEVFGMVKARLHAVRQQPSYPAVFRALAREALAGVTGRAKIGVDPQDVALATEVLNELGVTADVETGLSTAGGLRVEVQGGRVVIDNTLEARLAKAERFLRPDVNKSLFR